MKPDPKVILGMPAYNRPDTMQRTLESLLSQTYRDFALVIVEDDPSARTGALVEPYASERPHVHYERNRERLGMVGNWRKVFDRGRELYPRSEYFAWVSDHDLWHARWLEEMVSVLDSHPEVVLAYPENMRIMPDGARQTDKKFETSGIADRAVRLRASARGMLAGDMIYGLMRADALQAAGVFRYVVTPDRQVLLELALFGQFRQVPEVLWYREVVRALDVRRQREVFFPGGVPLYMYLSSHVQHCGTLLWDFVVRGKGKPAFGRMASIRYAAIQLWHSLARQYGRPKSEWRVKLARPDAR